MDYKYVYLGYCSDYFIRYNNEMVRRCEDVYNVIPLHQRLSGAAWLLYRIHMSYKINRVIRLPYKALWLNCLLDNGTKTKIKANDKVVFDISGWYLYTFGAGLLCRYLRNAYSNCRIVAFLSDKVELFQHSVPGFDIEEVKKDCDIVFSYNSVDIKKYGLMQIPLVVHDFSDIDITGYKKNDIFFVGQDKGRLNKIYEIFEKCTAYGLKCDFHLVGIEASKQKHKDKISFGSYMPYEEALRRSKAAKCILSLLQSKAQGLTIRDTEVISLNKVLMTDGTGMFLSDLYNPRMVVNTENIENEIDKIVNRKSDDGWNNLDKHSPEKYFDWIKKVLYDKY